MQASGVHTPVAAPHWLKPQHLLFLVLINFLWGVNLLTTKFGVREIPPFLFTCLRVGVILVGSLPWLRWYPGQMLNLFKVAMLSGVGGFGFLVLGISLSKDVSTVAIFAQLIVPFSVLLSVFMLGEVIHWRRKFGIALAFIGVFVIGFDARAFSYLPGLLCVVLHALTAAAGMVYVRRLHDVHFMSVQAWVAVWGLPPLLLLSLWLEHDQVQVLSQASAIAWGAVAFAGIASSLIGQSGLFYLLKRYPVSMVSPMTVMATVFAMISGVLFNHDVLTPKLMLGAALTMVGVLIIELRSRKQVIPAAAS